MKKSLLVVYNICGISKRENSQYYIPCIKSILAQHGNCHCIISGCLASQQTKNKLYKEFDSSISYNWIEEKHPLNVTFNHTVIQAISNIDKFDGYVYVDSGCGFLQQDSLNVLYNLLTSCEYGMISTRTTDVDDGYFLNLGIGKFTGDKTAAQEMFKNGDYTIPIGKTVNLITEVGEKSNLLITTFGVTAVISTKN